LAGLLWFVALAYRPFNAGTYFSENALLPGLVETDFKHDHGAADYLRNLKDHIRELKEIRELRYRLPASWLEAEFRGLGLDTYIQNFTFHYPAGMLEKQKFPGQNVYGILRAPRAASTEALVLSVPYRPPEGDLERTHVGIALLLAMAKSFRKHTYWAKDIIFLITEYEQVGMQAWLDAYHESQTEFILPGELHGRSGSIQAAINMELGVDILSKINVKPEGLNGQLPNLDLINTVAKLCRREGISVSLQNNVNHYNPESRAGFEHALKTMLMMMWNQASGIPTGNHGLYHRYHIEAVTLEGVKVKGSPKSFGLMETGKVVEGIFRSLNNLLERFHQSFFFYLLPATDRYVSIGLYMPPFGLLAAPVLIKAVALWIAYCYHCSSDDQKKSAENKAENVETEKNDAKSDGSDSDKKQTKTSAAKKKKDQAKKSETESAGDGKGKSLGVWSVIPVCTMACFFGLCAFSGPSHFIQTAEGFHMQPADSLTWGMFALLFSSCVFPSILKRKSAKKGDRVGADPRLLKCIALLSLGMVLGATSLLNISLAFFITVIWTPFMLILNPSNYRILRWLQYLLMLAISPLSLLYFACVIHHCFTKWATVGELHFAAWASTQEALLKSVIDGYLFGNWTYSLIAVALYPVWVLMWALLWTQPLSS